MHLHFWICCICIFFITFGSCDFMWLINYLSVIASKKKKKKWKKESMKDPSIFQKFFLFICSFNITNVMLLIMALQYVVCVGCNSRMLIQYMKVLTIRAVLKCSVEFCFFFVLLVLTFNVTKWLAAACKQLLLYCTWKFILWFFYHVWMYINASNWLWHVTLGPLEFPWPMRKCVIFILTLGL